MAGTRRKDPSQYDFLKQHFDEVLLPTTGTKRRSSVRTRKIQHIDIHHMTVQDSDNGAANFKCLEIWKNREASAHYCVDNRYVLQAVYDNRMAWGNGNGTANQEGIIVEHANSTLAPTWQISDTTLETSAKLVAGLHITHELGRPTSSGFGTGGTIRTHQSFFATACPGPYFKKVWSRYVKMVQAAYDVMVNGSTPTVPPAVEPATGHVVAPGDTLSRIAKANRLDVDDLAAWNGITDKDVIRVGQLLTLVKPEVIPPVCPVPEPVEPEPVPPKDVEWVDESILFWNLAGYNAARGEATALKRVPAICAYANSTGADVLVFVEASKPMLAALDKGLPDYQRALRDGRDRNDANGAGREVYVRRAALVIKHVVFGNVTTMLNGDDKPMLGVVYAPKNGGTPRAVVAAHNENQDGVDTKTRLDADMIRVRQLRENLVFLVHKVAAPHKVPLSNQALGVDANSYEWALDEAERMNWRSSFDLAASTDNAKYATHTNWRDELVEAGHFDLVLLRHDSKVVSASQSLDPDTSDHNPILVVRKVRA